MDINELIGKDICVLGADLLPERVPAVIRSIDASSQAVLLEFVPPVQMGGAVCTFAVAHPRLGRDSLETLLSSGSVGCAITGIPSDRYDAANPFNLSWWRGGGAAIADLVL